jgi:hypothetical protein
MASTEDTILHWNNGRHGCTCGYQPGSMRELIRHCSLLARGETDPAYEYAKATRV